MTHPLTDETLEAIHEDYVSLKIEFDQALRAAADWQLECDAEYFAEYLVKHFGFAPEIAQLRAEWFKEEMRPQENN